MSCQVNVVGNIADIGAIRRCLFPTDDSRGSDSWLQQCILSVSPVGNIIAIANDRRLVILTSKYDSNSSTSQFHVSFSGSVHESDNIRAVACLPIVAQSKLSQMSPDWTCIMLGFESGYLRFYTENCELLMEEQLHCEIISGIKCRSQHNPKADLAPDLHPEEIYIHYQRAVCVIAGTQLFTLLRSLRADFARLQAKGEILEPSRDQIAPRKWGFQDQATINDVAVVGLALHNTFDHLLAASTCGGFEARYSGTAPIAHLVLAAGSRPFLGYHFALEGVGPPVLSDVAKAVATKLKSALPGWLTGNNKTSTERQMTVAMQPSDTMGCRFGLSDLRRTATKIVLSPNHKLAAVSDALGRVLLVDALRGIILKIFKGYRDAQCAFVQVPDERHSKHRMGNKVALFLIIYSAKKGTLEIFSVQKGTKVSTFTASKFSTLVYNNYGFMGFPNPSKTRFVCPFDTLLIDSDGQIKDITIPFYFALDEKSSTVARDLHLYKKLRAMLKEGNFEEVFVDEGLKICAEIETGKVKMQTVELLTGDRRIPPEISLKLIETLAETRIIDNSIPEAPKNVELENTLKNSLVLIKFYIKTQMRFLDEENGNNDETSSDAVKLGFSGKELENLQKLLDLASLNNNNRDDHHVKFKDTDHFTASDFLSLFDLKQPANLTLKLKLEDSLLYKGGRQIFEQLITRRTTGDFEENIKASKIAVKDFFKLLLHFWINRPMHVSTISNLEHEMNRFHAVVRILSNLAPSRELVSIGNSPSVFWGEIREILANSAKPFPALTAAILCKTVSQSYERVTQVTDEDAEDFDTLGVEILTPDLVNWTLLIGKLEDVSLLNIIISSPAVSQFSKLPKLHHETEDVSLKFILEHGSGSVSELVARWLTSSGVHPENIVINERFQIEKVLESDSDKSNHSDSDSDEDIMAKQEIPPHKIEEITQDSEIFSNFNAVKSSFPHSLLAGKILANMCWEYALAWQKDMKLEYFEASVECADNIPDCHIRNGMCRLLWNTHLKITFESASKLVNKVGKLPKERLCRQDTGLADYQIVQFFAITTNFLEKYLEVLRLCQLKTKSELKFESLWETRNGRSLVEIALDQETANYEMVQLHFQLSLLMNLLTSFPVKFQKPINSTFDNHMMKLMFGDLRTSANINWEHQDARIQEARMQLLKKIIHASCETVSLSDGKIFSGKHVEFVKKILLLAQLWNLSTDPLRLYELVQLYVNGFDNLANSMFTMVQDQKTLGQNLLEVVGKRLKNFLDTSPSLGQNMAALTPEVTGYIKTLNDEWCAPGSLEEIESLAYRSLHCLRGSNYEHKLAEMILEGVKTLRQIHDV